MVKYYYDTGVFGHFLLRGDWEHKFSPSNVQAAHASLFCDEELIYAYMKKGDFSEYGADLSFIQVSEKLLDIGAFFTQSSVDIIDIRQKFIYMMGVLAQNNIDLREDFVKFQKKVDGAVKPLEGMDWLHLAVADLMGCGTILTTDGGFKYLQKVSKMLKLDNVKRIIILSADGKLDTVKEINIE